MKLNYVASALLGLSVITTGCGGGGGGTPAAPTTLSGTAAAGAALIGTVTVKGALGNTKSALIEADGTYDVDVTGLTAPYRLRAQGTVGGRTYKLHSYAVAADVGGNVNITPFTDLIVANAAQQIAESFFDSSTTTELDPAVVEAQEDALQAKLQDVFTAVGVDAAINLLNSTFSADHSQLDAALDLVRVEVDATTNVATITNLIEGTSITDSVLDTTDNTATLTVTDATALTGAVTDTQAIAALFDSFSAAYANGLPALSAVQDYFATDFLLDDYNKGLFLTEITTDPGMIGTIFSGITVSNLDSTAGTAQVTFSWGANGMLEYEPETWFVAKDATLGWQLRGNQQIVETYFSYHCNDYDGAGSWTGSCGINTQFWDEDFTNNGTGGLEIKSGTVEIIDGTSSAVKATVYLGTPAGGTAGDVQVYNEADGNFYGDWKEFGTTAGKIDPSVFAEGDIIQYTLYTADLVTTVQASPAVTGAPVATYTETLLFAPSTTDTSTTNLYPTLTSDISGFTLGSDLSLAWTLADGTRNEEVLVEIQDSAGNRLEIWDWNFGTTATTKTISSSQLDASAASTAGLLTTDTTYSLKVRIYAEDSQTGQSHSRDYDVTIPGPAAVGGGGGSSLTCGYQSGWDDTASAGLGAPITPNSFADYEGVVQDCLAGTASTFTAADIESTVYVDGGLETSTFNALAGAAGTEASRGTGTYDDGAGFVLSFQWWVEAATCTGCNHSYVVIYTDSTLDADLPAGFWIRETTALTSVVGTPGVSGASYTMYRYSEQQNYSDADRAVASDGEIWSSANNVLQ